MDTEIAELEQMPEQEVSRTFNYFKKFVHNSREQFEFNNSSFMAAIGKRRSGKSVFCLGMACAIDPNFNEEQICFGLKDLKEQLNTKTKTSIIWEEAGTSAYSRDFMQTANKLIIKTLQVYGYRKIALLGNFQHLKFLDGDVRLQLDCFFKLVSNQQFVDGKPVTTTSAQPFIVGTDWIQEPFIAPYNIERDGVFVPIGYIPIPQMDVFFRICGVSKDLYKNYLQKKDEYFQEIGAEENEKDPENTISKKELKQLQQNSEAFTKLASKLITEKTFTKKDVSKMSGIPVTTLSRRIEELCEASPDNK